MKRAFLGVWGSGSNRAHRAPFFVGLTGAAARFALSWVVLARVMKIRPRVDERRRDGCADVTAAPGRNYVRQPAVGADENAILERRDAIADLVISSRRLIVNF